MYDFIGQTLNVLSGGKADLAAEQYRESLAKTRAAIGNAEKQREFLKTHASEGQGFIDAATAKSDDLLRNYNSQANSALGTGYNADIAGLQQGQSRLATLMSSDGRGSLSDNYQPGPDYAYKQQQGEQAIMRGAAAQGGRHGSAALQNLMGFNQNLASQDFNQYANRQIGLAGQMNALDQQRGSMLGQRGNQLAQLYSGLGSNLSNIETGAASAKANIGMGLSGNNIQVGQTLMQQYQNPVQYAGAGAAANAAQNMSAIGQMAGMGAYYLGQPNGNPNPAGVR